MSGNQEMNTYMCGRNESIFGGLYYDRIEETTLIMLALSKKITMENTKNNKGNDTKMIWSNSRVLAFGW